MDKIIKKHIVIGFMALTIFVWGPIFLCWVAAKMVYDGLKN
jgi:hypothetical protein